MKKTWRRRALAAALAAALALAAAGPACASGTEEPAGAPAADAPAPQPQTLAPEPASQPAAEAPETRTGVAEGAYEAPGGDDWNWKEDLSVKVSADAGGAQAAALAALPCRNALLVCADTGDVLYEKDADARVPIASITKVMTLLLTFEAVERGEIALTDAVPISQHACEMGGSQIWLEPGEHFTLEELVKAICISSANDAAVAVAEYVGGSEAAFVDRMNARAGELGMQNTHFANACGLDAEGHYSSARDVAAMSRALLCHEEILHYSGIWMDTLRGGETQLVNTNRLLRTYEGATGLKTGTTSGAGVCIAATARRDGMTMLAVVLGAPSSAERFVAAADLLDYGFAGWQLADVPAAPGLAAQLPVTGGVSAAVELRSGAPAKVLVKKGEAEKLETQLLMGKSAAAPVAQGQQLGEIVLTDGRTELARWPVSAAFGVEKMQRADAWRLLWQSAGSAAQ